MESENLKSKAVAVYNLDDGELIFGYNATDQRAVASLTKIMVAYLAAEKLDFDQEIEITQEMVRVDSEFVVAGLAVGQRPTVEELMYMTMLPSAADAAQALGISVSGNLDEFVELMNETAKEFGMTDTHFSNTYGLDGGNYSTAEDIVKMIAKVRANENFRTVYETNEYFSKTLNKKLTKTVAATAEKYGLELGPIVGAKTGYTEAAGRCLGSTGVLEAAEVEFTDAEVVEGETNLAVVTLGASGYADPLEDSLAVYEFYQKNYVRQKIASTAQALVTLKILSAKEEEYVIQQPTDVVRYLPVERNEIEILYFPAEKLKREEGAEGTSIRLANGTQELSGSLPEITSEIEFEDELGEIQYLLDGEVLYSFTPKLEMEIHFINYPLIIGLGAMAVVAIGLAALVIRRKTGNRNGRNRS